MYLKGSSETEISASLRLNQSNVSRALEVMRKRNAEWLDQHRDPGGYLRSLLKEQKDRALEVVREAWTLYESIAEVDVARKIQALGLVRNAIAYLGQILGLEAPALAEFQFLDRLDELKWTVKEFGQQQPGTTTITSSETNRLTTLATEKPMSPTDE